MKNLSKLLLLASILVLPIKNINSQSVYTKQEISDEKSNLINYIEINNKNPDKEAPLFPSKYYSIKETINLMREITKIKDPKKDVYMQIYLAGRPFIVHAKGDSIIEYFNDRTMPRDKKIMKKANRNKRFKGLPFSSAHHFKLNANLEYIDKQMDKEETYQAQAIKKE